MGVTTKFPILVLASAIWSRRVFRAMMVRSASAGVYCGISERSAMKVRKLFSRLTKLMCEVEMVSGVDGPGVGGGVGVPW